LLRFARNDGKRFEEEEETMTATLATEQVIVQRILDHIDRKTTDLADDIWHEPVENYTSPARFETELIKAFRRTPTPFCPSAALTEVGSYVARDAALTPIIAIRGSDGKVRAFRNACRHRGVQLADGSGCKKALTCRYHGWTYGLDGALRGIPDEHGFPGLDKSAHGLTPVATVEQGGMVFVAQDADIDASALDLIPDLFAGDLRLYTTAQQEFDANWKIVAEGFLEGYHIRSTHTQTFFPLQFDNLNVTESFGRNSRISFPYRRIEKLRGVPMAERRTAGMLTHVYHLFPNVMIATFPTNMIMTVLEPLGVSRTRFVTYTLSSMVADDDGRAAIKQGRDFVTAGAAEDREMATSAQRGLASGANTSFVFGLFEGAIGQFHRNLHELVERG
jgi:phenylpropionate dioxygenase-like ring-hydroxylating dioxygenase large terminal subunit